MREPDLERNSVGREAKPKSVAPANGPDVTSLKNALLKAKADQSFSQPRPDTKSATIRALTKEIGVLRAANATWAEITKILNTNGLYASVDLIRMVALSEENARKKKNATKPETEQRRGQKPNAKTKLQPEPIVTPTAGHAVTTRKF